jgi:anti-sigma factor RsiW
MRAHPAEGLLQGLLDGELPAGRALLLRAHLLRCATCRARINATRETAALVGALIRRSTPIVDSESAWARLMVRSGGRVGTRLRGPMRWPSAAALVLATAVLLVAILRGASRTAPGDDAFALVREAQAHPARTLLRDACCSDHDGGDRADDGLLTLSRPGETVTVVIVYEDVDRSGTFTPGDVVRYISTIPHAAPPARRAH